MVQPGGQPEGADTPAFSFARAVDDARRDFPKETANTTFIDGSADDAHEKLYAWAVAQKFRTIEWERILLPQFEGKQAGVVPGHNGGMLMIMHPDRPSNVFPGATDKCNHYTFDHELGHLVAPKGTGRDVAPDLAENVADSFAVLRGLQRGTLVKQDLAALSAHRDSGFLLYGGLSHLTSMAIDSIIINPRHTDFMSLSPLQTARIATRHAEAFDKPARLMEKFEQVAKIGKYRPEDGGLPLEERLEQRLHALTEICMKARPASMTFYLAARIVVSAIDAGGATYVGQNVPLQGGAAHWQDLKEAILKRAGDRDIGGRQAMLYKVATRSEENSFMAKIKQALMPLKI